MAEQAVEYVTIAEFVARNAAARLSPTLVSKMARSGYYPAVCAGNPGTRKCGKWLIRSDALQVVEARQAQERGA